MSNLSRTELLSLFDLKTQSQQKRYGDRATITRVYRPDEEDAFVEKTYEGNLSGLQQRENALLFHVSTASVEVGGGTKIRLNSRIAPMHQFKNRTAQGIFEIVVRWQGFDLMDWAKLAPSNAGADHKPLMQNAIFLLALARSTLRALHLMHKDGLIHSDIKADNLCLRWLPGSLQHHNGICTGQLFPDALKIIDLGITLKQRSERGPIPDLAGMIPSRAEHAPRLVAAYEQHLQSGNTRLFEDLDWRVDVWAVGHMLQTWASHNDFLAIRSLSLAYFELAQELKDIEGDFVPGQHHRPVPQSLPHERLIHKIDSLIGDDDMAWTFSVAVPGGSGKSQPAVDTLEPESSPSAPKVSLWERISTRWDSLPEWLSLTLMVVGVIAGYGFIVLPLFGLPFVHGLTLIPTLWGMDYDIDNGRLLMYPMLLLLGPMVWLYTAENRFAPWLAGLLATFMVSCWGIGAYDSTVKYLYPWAKSKYETFALPQAQVEQEKLRSLSVTTQPMAGSPKAGAVAPAPVVAAPVAALPASAPTPIALIANRYQPQGDGSEVLDTQTGLTWQRFSVGQRWDAKTGQPVGEAKKFTFKEAQKLAGGDWRLPTVRELFSLVQCSKGIGFYTADLEDGGPALKNYCLGEAYQRPTIHLEAFPGTAEDPFWSSSPHVGSDYSAWFVGFRNGHVNSGYGRDYTFAVRLVRAGQ